MSKSKALVARVGCYIALRYITSVHSGGAYCTGDQANSGRANPTVSTQAKRASQTGFVPVSTHSRRLSFVSTRPHLEEQQQTDDALVPGKRCVTPTSSYALRT
eukprot:6212221-Pleurochrysis_carterae.AAC.2